MSSIIQRIIDKEFKFRNNTQLMTYPISQLKTNRFHIVIDIFYDFLTTFRREHAKIYTLHKIENIFIFSISLTFFKDRLHSTLYMPSVE